MKTPSKWTLKRIDKRGHEGMSSNPHRSSFFFKFNSNAFIDQGNTFKGNVTLVLLVKDRGHEFKSP
jgi:hypothetical protein